VSRLSANGFAEHASWEVGVLASDGIVAFEGELDNMGQCQYIAERDCEYNLFDFVLQNQFQTCTTNQRFAS